MTDEEAFDRLVEDGLGYGVDVYSARVGWKAAIAYLRWRSLLDKGVAK